MKKFKLFILIVVLIIAGAFILKNRQSKNTIVIGIVEPLEHKAMDEIVKGFSKTLKENFHGNVEIKVENAQNDMNLQRSLIEKMNLLNYNMVVPIGLTSTEMSISLVNKSIPIVSLASSISEQDRVKMKPCHVDVIQDEIPVKTILEFIHMAYPNLTEIVLVHSSSEKVIPQVQETISAGKLLGIKVSHYMVSTLPELMATTQSLPQTTQAIIVLKDHLIVSGISTLAQYAIQKHFPLISSDEGSVEGGATFAIGVREENIGQQGGILAAKILNGKQTCTSPIEVMKNLHVFINKRTLSASSLQLEPIEKTAKAMNNQIELIQ